MFTTRKATQWLFTLLIALPLSISTFAAEQTPGKAIGYVMKTEGDASVITAGSAQPATVGTPVFVNSSIKTGANGSLGVTLEDNTVMSFGPNSQLSFDAFVYEPSEQNLKLSAKITHGTLNYISGVIAKLKPEAVEINTPTGTIGVRGTHFLVKVDG
ncbi:MAG: FecR domain-containing protein [Pseudomonas sp.]|uniref:FecR family protein n=1 Tax=Pseudomonas sp. TaxID=306 RepID=UPI0030F2D5C7